MTSRGRTRVPARQLLQRQRWEWVDWAFPNIAERHHRAERDRRARNADLAWYGLPPDINADRHLQGMSSNTVAGRGGVYHTFRTALHHSRADDSYLDVTAQRRSTGPDTDQPLARLALHLRVTSEPANPRWTAHDPEQSRRLQEQALSELSPEHVQVLIDGTPHSGELLRDGNNWAALIPLPDDAVDIELIGHDWPPDSLSIVTVHDLDPYLAGSHTRRRPLQLPRRPRRHD